MDSICFLICSCAFSFEASPKTTVLNIDSCSWVPSGNLLQFAIEHGHRNSQRFTPFSTWCTSIVTRAPPQVPISHRYPTGVLCLLRSCKSLLGLEPWIFSKCPYLENFKIPTDKLIFFRGVGSTTNHQPLKRVAFSQQCRCFSKGDFNDVHR